MGKPQDSEDENLISVVISLPGGCRQRIREFAAADMDIFICDEQGLRQRFTLAELLPHSFGPDNLG